MKILLIGLCVLFTSCKPPKFNQSIKCPTFQADNVSIYGYTNPDMFGVLYPDYTWVKVDKTECVISLIKKGN